MPSCLTFIVLFILPSLEIPHLQSSNYEQQSVHRPTLFTDHIGSKREKIRFGPTTERTRIHFNPKQRNSIDLSTKQTNHESLPVSMAYSQSTCTTTKTTTTTSLATGHCRVACLFFDTLTRRKINWKSLYPRMNQRQEIPKKLPNPSKTVQSKRKK